MYEFDGLEDDDPRGEAPSVLPPGGKPRRLAEQCATCIMKPESAGGIELRPGRRQDAIGIARRRESYIVCHETGRGAVLPAICRGFADAYSTNILRVWDRLGGFDDVPAPVAASAPDVTA